MGVIEAIAIQLPELSGAELPDVVPNEPQTTHIVGSAFLQSLLWRNQKCFSRRTFELLQNIGGEDVVTQVLIAIATEPENEFNAHYLHKLLWDLPMAARDVRWSIYVAQEGDSEGHPIWTLIQWVTHSGALSMEESRAELAAIALCWLFATSHRAIRDRATKALSALLSVRLPLAAELIHRFAAVDDPYVLDRILAGAYGAALQGVRTDGLEALAAAAYQAVFGANEPVAHVLIRDHARGIVELRTRGRVTVRDRYRTRQTPVRKFMAA